MWSLRAATRLRLASPAIAAGCGTALGFAVASTTRQAGCDQLAQEEALVSTYNANNPIEDRHVYKRGEGGELYAGVFDGHGGWHCADFVHKRLVQLVQKELKNWGRGGHAAIAAAAAGGKEMPVEDERTQVKRALTRAFLRAEREFLYQVKAAFDIGFGDVARSGACAILAMARKGDLYVANAGDCRAVLGRHKHKSRWSSSKDDFEAVALSRDHNAREPEEQAKLRTLHPFEENIIRCKRKDSCYVKGKLQPTRSIGDAYLKFSEFNGVPGENRGRYIGPPYTPPYVSAEPEITVHSIEPGRDAFVVIASDGVWDMMSNEEVVKIVGEALARDGSFTGASDLVVKKALEVAAAHHMMAITDLQALKAGRTRRDKHDDMTCVIMDLKQA